MPRFNGYVRYDDIRATWVYVIYDTMVVYGRLDIVERVTCGTQARARSLLRGSLAWWQSRQSLQDLQYFGAHDARYETS